MFKNKKLICVFATLAAFAWGWAYPLIKLGMEQFNIESDDTWGKTLFAGVRFFLAGVIVLVIAKITKRDFSIGKGNGKWLILLALTNTALHYFCFYVGLSYSYGSRASILNSLGTFLLVIVATFVFADEKLDKTKIIGCIIGFVGLLVLNIGSGDSGALTFMGDGMIILNALCSVCGGLITRILTRKMDAIVATGESLMYGGMMLVAVGFLMGGRLTTFSLLGAFILVCLVLISSVAFSLYNQLLRYHPVGKVSIYNSLIPVFGTVLSCIFLKETFYVKYVFSAFLVAMGIYVLNHKKGE